MNNPAIATVNTAAARVPTELNPRATRYGIIPIWSLPVQSRSFYVWEIPANILFPFRPFIGETIRLANDEIFGTNERLPETQIADMYIMTPYFIELKALGKLQDESKVEQIAEVLYNPKSCNKYARELGRGCVSCWLEYLNDEATERVAQLFGSDNEISNAAMESIESMREGFKTALGEASRRVDIAIRDIDNPESGKTVFYDVDYLNVYHTHNDKPQYKTTTNANNNIGQQIADAIVAANKPAAVDNEQLVAILKEMQELKSKVESYEKVNAPDGFAYTPDLRDGLDLPMVSKISSDREAKKKFLIEKIESASDE